MGFSSIKDAVNSSWSFDEAKVCMSVVLRTTSELQQLLSIFLGGVILRGYSAGVI